MEYGFSSDESLTVTPTDVGAILREFRRTRRWNQDEVATEAGTTGPHLSSIENGRKGVGIELLARLLSVLGVTWTEFGRAVDAIAARRAVAERRKEATKLV